MSHDDYKLEFTLTGHTGTITALEFSPDSRFLASGSNHGVLLLFSTSTWRPLKRLIDASPITTIVWHSENRYLLLCGCESGDLYFLSLKESLEIVIDSTSYFDGPIRSLSLLPETSALAVGHGEDVSVAKIKSSPYGLDDAKDLLPKPPSHVQSSTRKQSKRIAMSLHFLDKNQLVVTYLDHGIVFWNLTTMSARKTIPASARAIGRSIFCRGHDVIASSNPLSGVDWYSMPNSKFITSSKVPISRGASASSMAYVDGGDAIVTGGLSGWAYIVSCRTFEIQGQLDHGDRRNIESVAFSSEGARKLVATGAIESEGASPINIWISTVAGKDRATAFMTARNIDVTKFTWSGVLAYSAFLLICYTWIAHFTGN